MGDKVHLFHVGNYFHLLISHSIIEDRSLNKDCVFFVTYRGFKLPPVYLDRLLFDKDSFGIKEVILNIQRFNKLFGGKEVCVYCTFQYTFPLVRYFSEYVFFEDGASALGIRHKLVINYWDILREIKLHLRLFGMFYFREHNIKGLCHSTNFFSPIPRKSTLYRLSDKAYRGLNIHSCKIRTISVASLPVINTSIHDSVIIAMDRIVNRGRPYDIAIYFLVLNKFLYGSDLKSRNVYLKLHPADSNNLDALSAINKSLTTFKFEVITSNLEDIAMSDLRNIFVGTNSTILYYAPIFGKTNRSISFARLLAERDCTYKSFLDVWGGIEGFRKTFGENVEIS